MSEAEKQPLSRETQAFLDQEQKLLIGGAWSGAQSGDKIEVFDPATERLIAEVPAAGPADIDQAVAAARDAFERGSWSTMAPARRGELLWKLADLIEANGELFTELEILDNGMPYDPVGQLAVPGATRTLRYFAGWPTKIAGLALPLPADPRTGKQGFSYTKREPVGVVGQIIPWNYPLGMAVMKLGPALAAGCTVVLKPAELTPLSALFLGKLIQQAGFPDGVVNIVPGYGQTAGAALAEHDGVDKVAFTGSTAVGKKIIEASAGNLKRVTLELGGKSPFIVFPDADLDAVIASAARAAFFLQGQNCMCASRLLLHEDIYDQVLDGIAKIAKAMPIGPGWKRDTRIGPLISAGQKARVMSFIDSGKCEGAEVVTGGNALDRPGHFIEPTVFGEANPSMKIVREEIFGPVTTAQRFSGDDLDDVIGQANNTVYGLVASVWTRDLGIAHKVADKIRAGVVGINHHGAADISVPFGGFKQSGWGRENGAESLNHYLETKAVVARY